MKKYSIMFLIGLSISLPAHASSHQKPSQMGSFQACEKPQETSHQNGAISLSLLSDPRPVDPTHARPPPSFAPLSPSLRPR